MKRTHKKEYEHGVYGYFSLLSWQQCCKCKKDFRREKGFMLMAGPFYGGRGRWYYLCNDCAPDIDTAHKLAIAGCYMPERPAGPPPPPPPKKK